MQPKKNDYSTETIYNPNTKVNHKDKVLRFHEILNMTKLNLKNYMLMNYNTQMPCLTKFSG